MEKPQGIPPSWRKEAAAAVRSRTGLQPKVGIILGSGLGPFAEEIQGATVIPYAEIPHFPVSTVPGHAGRLVLGRVEGVPVVAMQGRVHAYEGYPLAAVAFPVWVMKELGVETLIASNAAGSLNPDYHAGDLMLITDHLNFVFDNPLVGPNDDELGPRFPASDLAYTPELQAVAREAAAALGVPLREGVYAWIRGPIFETAAFCRFLRQAGADAIGMSTVPEILAAVHCGMRTVAISCLTDELRAKDEPPLTHEEVLAVAERVGASFRSLLKEIVRRLA
ncbi:MAG: purine-nucleoside phosphorylase [Firmicutes bacterium]|nr:purine-nucleoside phosphorylase [Bacillota bacterium]